MGANDTLEQLEAARAEVIRLESDLAKLAYERAEFESMWARAVVAREEALAELAATVRQRDAAFSVVESLGLRSRVDAIRGGGA